VPFIQDDKNNLISVGFRGTISVWHLEIKQHFLLLSGRVCGSRGKWAGRLFVLGWSCVL